MLLTLKKALKLPNVLILCICTFVLAIIMSGTYPLMSLIVSHGIGLKKTELTFFFINNLLVGIVITFLSGFLSDRLISRYKIVAVSGLLASIGLILLAQVEQITLTFLSGSLTAFLVILFPQFFAFGNSTIFQQLEEKDRLIMVTFLRTLFSLGYIVGPVLTGLYVTLFSYTQIYFIMASLTLVLTAYSVIFMRRILKEQAQDSQSVKQTSPETINDKSIKWNSVLIILPSFLAIAFLLSGDSTRNIYLPLITLNLFGSPVISATMFSISAFTELFVMGFVVYVASKIGTKPAIAAGAVIGCIYFSFSAYAQSLWMFYVLQILYAFFITTLLGIAMAYIQRLIKDRAGLGAALFMNATQIGSMVGYLLPMIIKGNSQKIFLLSAVMCCIGCGMLFIRVQPALSKDKGITQYS